MCADESVVSGAAGDVRAGQTEILFVKLVISLWLKQKV
jgi:hypothetical protein